MAGRVPADTSVFHNRDYTGINHLNEALERHLQDAEIRGSFFQSHPRVEEGTFTVDVLDPNTPWVRGRPLAEQARTQSTPLRAEFNKDDASTYLALAKKVLDTKGKLPKSYSAKRLADVRELMRLEMRILHGNRVGCEQAESAPAEGRCGASTGEPRLRSGAPQSADSRWLQAPGVVESPTSEAVAPLHPVPLLQAQNRLLRHQCVVLIDTGAAIAAWCLIQRESLDLGRLWQGRLFSKPSLSAGNVEYLSQAPTIAHNADGCGTAKAVRLPCGVSGPIEISAARGGDSEERTI
jgi:hypothetical protein